ncbi:MAG: GyrI-like domain-containing protein [Mariprofundaceae bacterium]|nr:GyrI-like domain-containing protein [Mariprofundaceae bacterium]
MRVNIVNIKAIKVAALEHVNELETLDQSMAFFRAWQKDSGCLPTTPTRMFGVALSDPDVRPIESFRFAICSEIDTDIAENSFGVMNRKISAGRCAKVRHIGSRDTLQLKVNDLKRSWLPSREEVKRDNPIFFEYLNFMPEVSENRLLTDIYFPLR